MASIYNYFESYCQSFLEYTYLTFKNSIKTYRVDQLEL